MNKQKTRKSILKLFKITAGGKLLRGHQAARHKRATKSKRRIRTFKKMIEVKGHFAKFIKKLI